MAIPHKIFLTISVVASWSLYRVAPDLLLAQSIWKTAAIIQISLTLSVLFWSVIIQPKLLSPLRDLPQPSGGSFFHGQFWTIFREPTGEPHLRWMATIPNDGLIYYTSWLNSPRLLVTSPDAMREFLNQKSYEFEKPGMFIRGVGRILGIGVLVAEGDEHRRQRKNLMPAFQYRHIKDLYPLFWEKTRELVLALDQAISNAPADGEKPSRVIEVGRWASRSTLDIIGVAGMGRSFNAIEDEQNELYQIYQNIFTPTMAGKILNLSTLFLPVGFINMLPVKRNNDLNGASHAIKEICRSMVREKKEKLSKGQDMGVDILSVAIKSGGFSDEDCVNQMMTFLVAGHETTASALTWALCFLSQHPHIQTTLRRELTRSALPPIRSPTSTLTADLLDPTHYPYLHAVTSEVLRFQPPVPFTMRENPAPTTLRGHAVPAKTTIVMAPLAINLSKDLWGPDADKFVPERWLDNVGPEGDVSGARVNNHGGAESNYAFMTFLHGPRSCIGQAFGRAEFACLLAGWVAAFEVALEDPERKIEVQGGITQRVKGGLRVVLTPVGELGKEEGQGGEKGAVDGEMNGDTKTNGDAGRPTEAGRYPKPG